MINREKGLDFVCAKAKHKGDRKLTLHPKNVMGLLDSTPYNLIGLRTRKYKLIYDDEKDSHELYDLKRDPLEKKNIYASERNIVDELNNLMEILLKKHRCRTEKDLIRMSLRDKDPQ